MNLSELPGLITKHVGMLKAAAGERLDNPGFNSMQQRQSIWEIGSQTVQEGMQTALNARDDKLEQAFGNRRGMHEQLAGIAGITTEAITASEQMFPKEAAAQDANVQTSSSQENLGGDVDTARHMGLAGRLAQQRPGLGKVMLAAHENFGLFGANPRESQRDTRNNAQGWMMGEHVLPTEVDPVTKRVTQVMSSKTALDALPLNVMAQRQKVWGSDPAQ